MARQPRLLEGIGPEARSGADAPAEASKPNASYPTIPAETWDEQLTVIEALMVAMTDDELARIHHTSGQMLQDRELRRRVAP